MKIFDILKLGGKKSTASVQKVEGYEAGTVEERQNTAEENYERAKTARMMFEILWKENMEYYGNTHYSTKQLQQFIQEQGWDFNPPVSPDPFIQVETLIDTDVPSFEFKANDSRMSQEQVSARERATQFVWDNNPMSEMNIENERSLGIVGTAFFKIGWDEKKKTGASRGDLVITNPDPANIFPDPSARNMDECEFCIHRYRMHKNRAKRTFPKPGGFWSNVNIDSEHAETEIYNEDEGIIDDDTVSIIEYYYRDEEGDISLSIFVLCAGGFKEIKHSKKYWKRTCKSGNQMYPIVRYRRIMMRQKFWGRGEIDFIKELVDSADRELALAVMNDMMMGNDIIIADEECWAEGFTPTTAPGSIWYKKQSANVQRLGGASYNGNQLKMIEYLHEKVQETNGNFNSQMGKEPQRVTTSSGIYQLNERADKRVNIKCYDRMNGFASLARLTDWAILEFYEDERMIKTVGDPKAGVEDSFEKFNSNDQSVNDQREEILPEDMEIKDGSLADNSPEAVEEEADTENGNLYFPAVDVSVRMGSPIERSKALTLSLTQDISQLQITPANAEIIKSLMDMLDMPNSKAIKDSIDKQMQFQNDLATQQANPPQAPTAPVAPEAPPSNANNPSAENPELQRAIDALIEILPVEALQVINQMPPDQQIALLSKMVNMNETQITDTVVQLVQGASQ